MIMMEKMKKERKKCMKMNKSYRVKRTCFKICWSIINNLD